MNSQEFSNQFDTLYNNITSNQAAGLNEYEKSVFLTKAQDEIVKNYFDKDSTGNTVKKGFDDTAIRQMDFSNIVKVSTQHEADINSSTVQLDPRSKIYTLPKDTLIIINEQLSIYNAVANYSSGAITGKHTDTLTGIRTVVPIAYNEYERLMSKPFKEPLKWQAWRLLQNSNSNVSEIVLTSKDSKGYSNRNDYEEMLERNIGEEPAESNKEAFNSKLVDYTIRYVKRPMPIILTDLSTAFGEDLSINGKKGNEDFYKDKCCELNESTHEAILQRAIELAKVAWEGEANAVQSHITAGQRSE